MIRKEFDIKIGAGEALDRHSILFIKLLKIKDKAKTKILAEQFEISINNIGSMLSVEDLYGDILNVNLALWDVEDKLRVLESQQDFGPEFVTLARQVYHLNDRRHSIKCQIDDRVGYKLVEQKEYVKYEEDSNISKPV
jgi:hypothetical protein